MIDDRDGIDRVSAIDARIEAKIREQHRSQIIGLSICAMLCLTLLGVVWMLTH